MATEDARKLFVAGLPESITEDVLRELFAATGATVMNVSLPKDRTTGRPRGFGFVTLSTSEEAESARQKLDGSMQAGRSISVRPFQSEAPRRDGGGPGPRSEAGPPSSNEDRTLYVGNLPYDTTQQEVEKLFSDNGAGPVVRIHLPTGPDGRLRGFGFVTLANADAANSAITALRDVDVRGRRLMVNIAHPRGSSPGGGGGPHSPRFGSGGPSGPRHFDPNTAGPPPDPNRASEGRRARGGGGDRPEGGGDDWDKKKKKKKRGGPAQSDDSPRGGANWQRLKDWDED
jgi:nucleolin